MTFHSVSVAVHWLILMYVAGSWIGRLRGICIGTQYVFAEADATALQYGHATFRSKRNLRFSNLGGAQNCEWSLLPNIYATAMTFYKFLSWD